MNRLWLSLLTLVLPAGFAHSQEVFEVNTKAQWETWIFPVGTLDLRADGSIKPVQFEQPFNAAPSSPLFTHELKKAGEQRGGVWKAGSNEADAHLIIDADTTTYWQPSQDDPLNAWWIEIDLGRMVAVKEVRLHFPDEEGARPLRALRVFASDGKFQSITDDVFLFNLIGGTTKRNEETLLSYPVAFGEATKRVLSFGRPAGDTDISTTFAPTQYIRVIADVKSEDAALAEVEVISFGQNIAQGTAGRAA